MSAPSSPSEVFKKGTTLLQAAKSRLMPRRSPWSTPTPPQEGESTQECLQHTFRGGFTPSEDAVLVNGKNGSSKTMRNTATATVSDEEETLEALDELSKSRAGLSSSSIQQQQQQQHSA